MTVEPDALADELFEADPKEFVAARDRLVKQLRADGKRDEAAQLKARRRPSVSAWALNQVARQHSSLIEELMAAVGRAKEAQDTVLSGGDRDLLRDALTHRRHALHAVTDAARAVVEESGRSSDAAARDIEGALQGPLTDAFLQSLRSGQLTDLEVGAGDENELSSLLSASVAAEPAPRASAAEAARRERQRQKQQSAVAKLEAELADAASAVRRASAVLEDAKRAHDRVAEELERARAALRKWDEPDT